MADSINQPYQWNTNLSIGENRNRLLALLNERAKSSGKSIREEIEAEYQAQITGSVFGNAPGILGIAFGPLLSGPLAEGIKQASEFEEAMARVEAVTRPVGATNTPPLPDTLRGEVDDETGMATLPCPGCGRERTISMEELTTVGIYCGGTKKTYIPRSVTDANTGEDLIGNLRTDSTDDQVEATKYMMASAMDGSSLSDSLKELGERMAATMGVSPVQAIETVTKVIEGETSRLQAEIKRLSPVDTGTLRDSIGEAPEVEPMPATKGRWPVAVTLSALSGHWVAAYAHIPAVVWRENVWPTLMDALYVYVSDRPEWDAESSVSVEVPAHLVKETLRALNVTKTDWENGKA